MRRTIIPISILLLLCLLPGCGNPPPAVRGIEQTSVSESEIAPAHSLKDLLENVRVEGESFLGLSGASNQNETSTVEETEVSEILDVKMYATRSEKDENGLASFSMVDIQYHAKEGHTIYETWRDDLDIYASAFLKDYIIAGPKVVPISGSGADSRPQPVKDVHSDNTEKDLSDLNMKTVGDYRYVVFPALIKNCAGKSVTIVLIESDQRIRIHSLAVSEGDVERWINEYIALITESQIEY